MGLLDSLAGQLGGDEAGNLLGNLLEQQGGIGGLLDKFQQGGLGEVAQSWVASGENLPVSSEQIEAVLGSETLAPLAEKLGIDPQTAAGQISALLPQLIDQLTPNGELPEGDGNLLAAGLDLLKGKLFS
ncbi:YidB family protein [Chitinilyticum aquatile]|uniref:YidB family protein n=1 Tax=Chitinilyticum aquatile TaxID=362520 RepID=UPI0004032C6A|nr:YidB family protein [Chitinilyticum aquatile]